MKELNTYWPERLLNQLQGPSSLGMALSGGAVGFSASILNPNVYVGFWTSIVFQMHAGFQLMSIAFGVLFAICRLRSNDIAQQLEWSRQENTVPEAIDQLTNHSRRLGRLTKATIYAQLLLLVAAAVSFIWLMLLYFHRALYPS